MPLFDFPTNSTLTALCNGELACIFDVAMTNNTALGEYTMLVQGEVDSKAKTLGNYDQTPEVIRCVTFF